MEYRSLGTSGLKVSALSFGSWVTFGDQVKEDTAYQCMKAAYDAGVNFFDTAEEYADGKAETTMGHILKRAGWKRSDLVISTKIFWGGSGPNDRGLSRKHIIEGTEASLARLHLDYVDLIYCHRPDIHTPIIETVRAMNYLINQGKAFYWGTSEWSSAQITKAYYIARRERLMPPTMEQPQYNMFHRKRVEKEYLPLYAQMGLGTTIYSPLDCGMLTGKYNNGMPDNTRASLPHYDWLKSTFKGNKAEQKLAKIRQLESIAMKMGISVAQLALAWCLKNPNVSSVITGASQPGQVIENMKAIDIVGKLSHDIMTNIESILGNKPPPEDDYR
ncbi:MAG: voltage-dependent potassium channel subunit beta [bacterium]|nr:voltage-dependent potassium channel subunit beta [bacterium]